MHQCCFVFETIFRYNQISETTLPISSFQTPILEALKVVTPPVCQDVSVEASPSSTSVATEAAPTSLSKSIGASPDQASVATTAAPEFASVASETVTNTTSVATTAAPEFASVASETVTNTTSVGTDVDALLNTLHTEVQTKPLVPLMASAPIQPTTAVVTTVPMTVDLVAVTPALDAGNAGIVISPDGPTVSYTVRDDADCVEVVQEGATGGIDSGTDIDNAVMSQPQMPATVVTISQVIFFILNRRSEIYN